MTCIYKSHISISFEEVAGSPVWFSDQSLIMRKLFPQTYLWPKAQTGKRSQSIAKETIKLPFSRYKNYRDLFQHQTFRLRWLRAGH